MDFRIDDVGELTPTKEELDNRDEYILQMAKSRLQSVSSDWYYDNIGADLEVMFGKFMTERTLEDLKSNITVALTFDELIHSNNVYVDITTNKENLSVKADVYIRRYSESQTSQIITVNLDLFNGILEM